MTIDSMRPSPLQNRCAPDGSLHAVCARGTFMGNRGGRLHGSDRRLGRARWKSRAWICCVLAFHGRHREVMGESYTEIFFLDEATALAAGHRPCFECRRKNARAFAAAWGLAQRQDAPPRAPEMDAALHAQRLGSRQVLAMRELPSGTIFQSAGGLFLQGSHRTLRWTFDGYQPVEAEISPEARVTAITPAAVRSALSAGYAPELHPSATPDS